MPRDIDRILDAWFEEGPTLAADRVVGAALTQTETVRQARPRFRGTVDPPARHRMAAWQLLAATLAITISLVGIGFATGILRIDRHPRPGPVDSSQPTPSPSAEAFTLFSSEADGYEILIPNGWAEVASEHPDARQWAGPEGELMISYGASIFDGGVVTACGPPSPDFNDCEEFDNPYSIPYDPELDGVGPLQLGDWLDRCAGGCPFASAEESLDGEPAMHYDAVIADNRWTYVSTFHNRRPIIIYWNEPVAAADESRVETMRSSFRFLEPAATESPEPFVDPTELVIHADTEAGYEVLVPRFWEEGAVGVPLGDGTVPGVIRMGSGSGAGTRGDPALTISFGNPDGSVFLCQPTCERVVVNNIDELEAAITSRYKAGGDAAPPEESGEMQLGGEPARWERPAYQQRNFRGLGIGGMTGGGNCLGCPQMRYHAFTIHNGRPIVLAFDYWNIAFERFKTDYVAQIIESFRFLD